MRFAKGQGGVDIEFVERASVVRHFFQVQPGKPFRQRGGFRSAVCFNNTDDDRFFLFLGFVGGQKHGVCFADSGRGTEKYFQPSPTGLNFISGNLL